MFDSERKMQEWLSKKLEEAAGAYAGELKSHLPFISDVDIIHVVISPHWPTLLRHFIFNEIFWMQRNILCLEPYKKENDQVQLRVYRRLN